ncbi:MAG: pyrroline-5-carboxylate reductase [Synergistaceae bacterium]|nr:pyrroline-5-carboxylate reductase [Synergistaceae bacterium]
MKISFIGAGHITELLINHLVSDVMFEAGDLTISDPDGNRCSELKRKFGVSVAADNSEAVSRSEFTFVCVQQHIVRKVAAELKEACLRGRILISVSAGISTGLYRRELPDAVVARILPNPPSAVGEGAIPVTVSDNADDEQLESIMKLVGLFGKCFVVPEDKIDIFTSLTSPAPVLTFFETMIDASVLCGLDRETSSAMVFQTIRGCLRMWEKNGFNLNELIVKSCTPAGTSVESLRVMDQMNFRAAVKESYRAAWERSKGFNKED